MEMGVSQWRVLTGLVALLVCLVDIVGTFPHHQYYWWLQKQQRHRKLHGPNVCAVEILPGSGLPFYTECRNWRLPRNICGRKAQITYDCCVGFEQIKGHPGCLAASRLENMIITLRRVESEWMAKTALATGFHTAIGKDAAVTVFAPSDKATEKILPISTKYQNDKGIVHGKKQSSVLHRHAVRGRKRLAELQHNDVLRPLHGRGILRIARYKNGMVTVNCARILSPNNEATDGIIHVIDRLLPTPEPRNVADILLEDSNLSQFSGLLRKTGLMTRLRSRHPVTVFAPIDKAFNQLSSASFGHVVRDKSLLKALLQYHLVADTWCSAGIAQSHHAKTLEGSTITLSCGGLDTQKVNLANVLKTDVVGKNGIIHYIDDILFPNRARDLRSLLSNQGFTKFLHFFTEAGLNTTLSSDKALTVLAPSNKAFNALPTEVARKFQEDVSFLRHVLLYHVISGHHPVSHLTTGMKLVTLEGGQARVHINPWCTTVESACLMGPGVKGLNIIVHFVETIILPPTDTVAEIIEEDSQFSVLRESLQVSGLVTVFQRPGAFTFLAPTDKAFHNLPSSVRDSLLRDPTRVAKILRYHVISDVHVSCSVRPNLVYPLVTLLGHEIYLRRQGDRIMVEEAVLVTKDIMATNGVIHILDKVLLPEGSLH